MFLFEKTLPGSKISIKMIFCLAMICRMVAAETGSDPSGMSTANVVYNSGINAAVSNPAILGSELKPWGGIRFVPFTSYAAGYWSDRLALTPYKEYFSIDQDGQWQSLVAHLVNSSFRVAGKSAEKTSEKITRKIKDGTSVYLGTDIPLVALNIGRVGVDVRNVVDVQVDLPAAPFLILFSDKEGLVAGNDIELTHLGASARVSTDISLSYGQTIDLSQITGFLNQLTREFTDFKYSCWGLGLTVSLGHGYLNLKTKNGAVHLSDDGLHLNMDADLDLKTAGTGLQNDWDFGNPYEEGFKLAGWGAAINAGVLMYGERSILSVALHRFGPMIWNDVLEKRFPVRTADISIAGIFDDEIDVFDPELGGQLPDRDDPLTSGGTHVGWQPTRFNIGLGYRLKFNHDNKPRMRALTEFINASFEYEQNLAPWPGRSFVPRIALGAENGFLWGVLPFHVGFIFGGAEKIASTAGFAVGLPYFRMHFGYKAVGTPVWYPRRGMELAFGLSTEWRTNRDPDKDGISGKADRCPYEAEDVDGFEDTDGCPDPDNDMDNIPDHLDKCPNSAEDMDGFEDSDGCPELDNDQDSVADSTDKCPDKPEDMDGFEDSDGCPDWDNDQDNIPDSLDSCINSPEDRDSIMDNDGCPEVDADGDGIADTVDQCPTDAEIFNFINDTDGCPDSVQVFSPEQKTSLDSAMTKVEFDFRGNLTQKSIEYLDSIALLLKSTSEQHYLVCWCDSTLPDSIANSRAAKISEVLVEKGLEQNRLHTPDSNAISPCSNLKDKSVPLSIKIIETVDELKPMIKTEKVEEDGSVPVDTIKQTGKDKKQDSIPVDTIKQAGKDKKQDSIPADTIKQREKDKKQDSIPVDTIKQTGKDKKQDSIPADTIKQREKDKKQDSVPVDTIKQTKKAKKQDSIPIDTIKQEKTDNPSEAEKKAESD